MILFNDSSTFKDTGITVNNALAYVSDVTILAPGHDKMNCNISLSTEAVLPLYTPYSYISNNTPIPYDSTSSNTPAAQCYTWLMANDSRFAGGSVYPVPN